MVLMLQTYVYYLNKKTENDICSEITAHDNSC